jgi:predicted RND superfamily exporter protein
MMAALARLLAHRGAAMVVVVLVLAAGGYGAMRAASLAQDDDLLAFLPAADADVIHFRKLADRFGGLDVALVGIEPRSGNVFEPDFLARLKKATAELSDTNGLDSVLSLDNVTDFVVDQKKGGIITGPLVHAIPKEKKELASLRKKALARDHVVGTFVSRDGRATVIYGFLASGSDPRATAAAIRTVVERHLGKLADIYWGGSPFISAYIFEATQKDMRRLTPWAVVAMVVIMLIAFRDVLGTLLALFSTGLAIALAMGVMALAGEPMNLVLGSMPVILFAVGSAYGIHILARFYARLVQQPKQKSTDEKRRDAMVEALTSAGPTVLAAGMTTVVSLLAFLAMDIRPMRVFGLYAAIGVFLALVLALTFIPAVMRLLPIRRVGGDKESLLSRLLALWVGKVVAARKRALVVLILLVALGGAALSRVENRIDQSNLFAKKSDPARADRFFARYFGGSQFLQLHVEANLNNPLVLRRITYLADQIRAFDGVTSVMHVADVIGRANDAMEGQRRVPDTEAKVRALHVFISGEAAIKQLVTVDRKEALIQVRLQHSDSLLLERILTKVERFAHHTKTRVLYRIDAKAPSSPGGRLEQKMVLARIRAALLTEQLALDAKQLAALQKGFALASPAPNRALLIERVRRFLRSEECTAALPKPSVDEQGKMTDIAVTLAKALVALGAPPSYAKKAERDAWERALQKATAQLLGKPVEDEAVEDVLLSVQTPLAEIFADEMARARARRVLAFAKIDIASVAKTAAAKRGRSTLTAAQKKARAERILEAVAAALLDLRGGSVLSPKPPLKVASAAKKGKPGKETITVRVNGMPTIHRALSRSALRNQVKSLGWALLPVVVIMALLFRSLRTGLLVAAPTALTLILIYGAMGLLAVRLDIGTAMLACIILGAGVDYAVHLVAAWKARSRQKTALSQAARAAVQQTGGAIWTNAITVAAGFFVLTLGDARPLQNVGSLTALAMLAAAFATFFVIPTLIWRSHGGSRRAASQLNVVDNAKVSDSNQ